MIQLTKLKLAFKCIFKKQEGDGDVSSFQALCTALSSTIGTGNIVGVATAIAAGGPGALFWMWISACFGLTSKFSECMLAIKYREVNEKGEMYDANKSADNKNTTEQIKTETVFKSTNKKDKSSKVKTGDETVVGMWSILMFISGLFGIRGFKRKKEI